MPNFGITHVVNKCKEPTEFTGLSFEQYMNISKAQSYSITPGWYKVMEIADRVPPEYIGISHKHFLGNRKCKRTSKRGRRHSESTLNNLSQCTWRYVENTDRYRKPETILEADCVCSNPNINGRKRNNLVCQSVIEYVNAYRITGCVNGVYEYKRVWEPRAVACVASELPEPKRIYAVDHKTPF